MATRSKRSSLFVFSAFITVVAAGILASPSIVSAQPAHSARAAAGDIASTQKIREDRGPIQDLDLYWGNASAERAPAGPFTFLGEDISATNPKAQVRDARGVLWGVKWDEEVRAEVAATRLAWAMGLAVDETYYVETGTMLFSGSRPTLQRIGEFIDRNGRFRSPARFERRGPEIVSKGGWAFAKRPSIDDSGFAVMVLMNVVMGNWDAKDSNNKIVSVPGATGVTDYYMISDYGACFGKMGGPMSHSKYELKDFVKSPPVITSVSGGTVYLGYKGRNAEFHESVPLPHARAFASLAANLSLQQVQDAFRAAHANEAELQGFSQAVYGRLREVVTKLQPVSVSTESGR
jgi:hypothetical protein